MGKTLKFLLLGDATVGQEALLRFYVLHVVVLPVVLTLFVAVHFWRIRKDGGLAGRRKKMQLPAKRPAAGRSPWQCPASGDGYVPAVLLRPASQSCDRTQLQHSGPGARTVRQGRQVPERHRLQLAESAHAELLVLLLTIAGVLVVSLFFNAPLEQPVNVMHPPNPAKAPWYFLGLQEQVSYSAFWGGIGVPAIEVLLLLLVPYIDRKLAGVGRWFARAPAGQFAVPDVRDRQRDSDHHWHILPRRELAVRVPVVRRW